MTPTPPKDIPAILAQGYTIDIGAHIQCGLAIFKRHLPLLLSFGGAFLGGIIVLAILSGLVLGHIPFVFRFAGLPVIFAYNLALGSLYHFILQCLRRKPVSFDTFLGFQETMGKVITAALIFVGIGAVSALIGVIPILGPLIGFLISLAMIPLCFTIPLVVDRGMDPIEAMQASFKVFLKSPLMVFVLLIICGIITALGLVVAGLPFASCILICMYVHIFGMTDPPSSDPYIP